MAGEVGMGTKTTTAWGFTDRTATHSLSPKNANCAISSEFGRDRSFRIGIGVESI